MPVFRAGLSFGRALAAAWDAPFLAFSHQEGHLAAGRIGTGIETDERYLAFHLSGGTSELLLSDTGGIQRIGGTRDLSFGQAIDRIGVLMGFSFPAGEALDGLASYHTERGSRSNLTPIPVDAKGVNLSGLETQAARLWQRGGVERAAFAHEIMETIASALHRWGTAAVLETGCTKLLLCGGVAESSYLRRVLPDRFEKAGCRAEFAQPGLSADNAVGIASMGGRYVWQ